jgi:uncharacterized protein YajQ (UPF0234 family)
MATEVETVVAEDKTMFQKQADRIREELLKASDKFQNIPQVKAAMDKFEENMEKLRKALDSDMAKKIFELLNKAKEAVYAAIEKAQQSPMGVKIQEKITEVQANANAKVEEMKAKVQTLRPQ